MENDNDQGINIDEKDQSIVLYCSRIVEDIEEITLEESKHEEIKELNNKVPITHTGERVYING